MHTKQHMNFKHSDVSEELVNLLMKIYFTGVKAKDSQESTYIKCRPWTKIQANVLKQQQIRQ